MDLSVALAGLALLVVLALLVTLALVVLIRRRPAPGLDPALEARLREITTAQNEIVGQFKQAIDSQSKGQSDLQRLVGERIDNMDMKLGANLKESSETLGGLRERLTVIDQAQKNLADISSQVISLKEIFSDKQARGALGQDQMEAIVSDHLSPDQYEFQASLTNGSRPDCAIRIPNVTARIVVDAKFPLESFEALRRAGSGEEQKLATTAVRAAMQKHVKDIAEKYLIPGETQPPAILFVPSDSMYAELHANFSELLRRAREMQVVIVSPHVFMLVIATIQGLMRDARVREQAYEIQKAVGALLQDVKRLGERVGDLRKHFDTTNKDIGQIEISMRGIDRHAENIARVELAPPNNPLPGER